jgi:hypothetical protein
VGEGVVVAGRGRMQFVTCSPKTFFEAGDYALFDDSSSIIVKPGQKTFAMPAVSAVGPSVRRGGAWATGTLRNLNWAIDALADREVVAGIPTDHYRVNVTFGMDIDLPQLEGLSDEEIPRPTARITTDYWYARVDGLPPDAASPFLPLPVGATPAARELSSMWATIGAQLAHNGNALKSHTVFEVLGGPVENLTTSDTVISDIRQSKVDGAALVLPREFTESTADMAAGILPPDNDTTIKWRTLPGR